MKTYDRICPVCGCLNRKLYLEETAGAMECERCGTISRNLLDWDDTKVQTAALRQQQLSERWSA